jgi:hypothetical protein
MDIEELRSFLLASAQKGYAAGDPDKWIKEKDGSTTITFAMNEFSLHDNFFGGEPYGGRTIVHYKDMPFWMCVYYGKVYDAAVNFEDIYAFLQKSLALAPQDLPVRGPRAFIYADYVYHNDWEGSLEEFRGEEVISLHGGQIYEARYMGGLVDQRQEQFQLV